jgi:hypothetical protein
MGLHTDEYLKAEGGYVAMGTPAFVAGFNLPKAGIFYILLSTSYGY